MVTEKDYWGSRRHYLEERFREFSALGPHAGRTKMEVGSLHRHLAWKRLPYFQMSLYPAFSALLLTLEENAM